MRIFTVTPERNVLINRNCFRSENPDLFFSKVVSDDTLIEIYDTLEKKNRTVFLKELNIKKHRLMINNKRFYICAVRDCG
jgi:hypothetical protein